MPITTQTLTEKLVNLHQQRDQILASLHQVLGAITLCEQLQREEADALKHADGFVALRVEDEIPF